MAISLYSSSGIGNGTTLLEYKQWHTNNILGVGVRARRQPHQPRQLVERDRRCLEHLKRFVSWA